MDGSWVVDDVQDYLSGMPQVPARSRRWNWPRPALPEPGPHQRAGREALARNSAKKPPRYNEPGASPSCDRELSDSRTSWDRPERQALHPYSYAGRQGGSPGYPIAWNVPSLARVHTAPEP